jgi:hypothetical protein
MDGRPVFDLVLTKLTKYCILHQAFNKQVTKGLPAPRLACLLSVYE